MDLQIFKEKNSEYSGSGIFEYRNLTDFEKILFLEHNVKELITLVKRKNNVIIEVTKQLDRVIEDYDESKQIKALKAEITNNLRNITKYKQTIEQMK